jgi:ABC-type Fe3+/spermidine/putrescine transport system ATPase subunit
MLALRGVARAFDGIPVLRGVDLDVARGEIVCLLGPSGCGKTTLLRIIAGLQRADAGDVRLEGESILRVPVHLRDFGLMFQDFALFPHMNVIDNVRFGLRMHGVPHAEQLARSQEALAMVGLSGFERRDVTQLSGGERQRVALARSLAPRPRLLMLDEPMGSLDAALRDRLVVEVREIIKRVGLTALYVTHDQAEAYAIADRIGVMNAGRIEQIGAPQDLYRRPQTVFVARFLGLGNIVPVTCASDSIVETPVGSFPLAERCDGILLHPDGLTLASPDAPHTIVGRLEESTFRGDSYRVQIQHSSGVRLELKWPASIPVPERGAEFSVQIDPAYIISLHDSAV